MKKVESPELSCQVMHARTLSSFNPLSLYEIGCTNGKYAVIRLDKAQILKQGDVIKRINNVWLLDKNIIKPLPFEYSEKQESDRYFIEFEQ